MTTDCPQKAARSFGALKIAYFRQSALPGTNRVFNFARFAHFISLDSGGGGGWASPVARLLLFSLLPPSPLLRRSPARCAFVLRFGCSLHKKIRRGTDMFVDNFFFRGLCIFIEGGARVEFFLPFPCCVPPFLSYSGSLPPAFNKLCLCPLSVINRCAYFFFSPLPFCPSAGLSTEHALPGYTQYARRFFLCTPAAQATAATGPRPASARRHGHRQHF